MRTVIKATVKTKNVSAYLAMPTKRTVHYLDVSIISISMNTVVEFHGVSGATQ